MRALTYQDYLLLTIVVVVALAGFCALLIAAKNLIEELRERALGPRADDTGPKVVPHRLPERVSRSRRISVIRH
jgi:hypothetical protein